HPMHWSLVILFAYGIHGLSKRYLEGFLAPSGARPSSGAATSQVPQTGIFAHLKTWWTRANAFDKKWTLGCLIAIVVSLLGWLMYATSRPKLVAHLQDIGFPDPGIAGMIAGFSIHEVGWFILFLVITIAVLTVILSGRFAGQRARWGGILLGVLLVVDLARA